MDSVRQIVEATIDFEGQKLVDKLSFQLLTFGVIVSFLIGFVCQRIEYSVYSLVATFVLTEIVVVFPWPAYNKNPVKWQLPTY